MTFSKVQISQALKEVDQEMFLAWRDHPITMLVMANLEQRRNDLKELWASGGLASPRMDEMAIKNAAAQGACSIIEDILGIDYVQLGEGE